MEPVGKHVSTNMEIYQYYKYPQNKTIVDMFPQIRVLINTKYLQDKPILDNIKSGEHGIKRVEASTLQIQNNEMAQ